MIEVYVMLFLGTAARLIGFGVIPPQSILIGAKPGPPLDNAVKNARGIGPLLLFCAAGLLASPMLGLK